MGVSDELKWNRTHRVSGKDAQLACFQIETWVEKQIIVKECQEAAHKVRCDFPNTCIGVVGAAAKNWSKSA